MMAQDRRSVINASLWDVMSTGLCGHSEDAVAAKADDLRLGVWGLLEDDKFNASITYGTNDTERVVHRFVQSTAVLEEILGVPAD